VGSTSTPPSPASWVGALGAPPGDPTRRERWLREVSNVAAYRDRWHVTSQQPLGSERFMTSIEQSVQYRRALGAIERAKALSRTETPKAAGPVLDVELTVQRGVER
jgi:hypothetical protein